MFSGVAYAFLDIDSDCASSGRENAFASSDKENGSARKSSVFSNKY